MIDLPKKQMIKLASWITLAPDLVVSAPIVEGKMFDITVFGMGEEETISTEIVGLVKYIFALSGELIVEHGENVSSLTPGTMLALTAHTPHSIIAKTPVCFQQIHIYQEGVNQMIHKIPHQQIINLADQIEVLANKKVSKSIVQRKDLSLTLFALDQDQQIARHTSTGDALVQILTGEALITIDQTDYQLSAGECIVMPANIPHALKAVTSFKMLLTVVKAGD
ncbi:cupin domain-containing protein [Amphibacillus sediminis]|uniref:cupin domain-containing protein n=1 Tax=Amphibacillus sediminis TaxID=360185 RepID=UPI000B09951E|nr:cupin domain-containing protein [Amphibacillus sediminis]